MKKNVRTLLLFVTLLGLMVFTSCSNNDNEGDVNNVNTQTSEVTEATETNETNTEQPSIEYLLESDWKDKYVPELDSKFADYLEGYDGYLALVEVNGDTMRISSSDYDGDARDNYIVREVKIAEDVTYSELSIKTIITDEGENSTDTYVELTEEDMEAILDSTLGIGFVWFNEDMEIEKIMLYGELTIWE